MDTKLIAGFLASLDERRRALGIPWDALATRAGTSRATICRLLMNHQATASFQTVLAVAEALGMRVQFTPDSFHETGDEIDYMLAQQAERQARKLVGIVQGTVALEAQAAPSRAMRARVRKLKTQLLSGPRRNLWHD